MYAVHTWEGGARLSSLPSSVQENVARKGTARLAQVCTDSPVKALAVVSCREPGPDRSTFPSWKHYTASQPGHVPSQSLQCSNDVSCGSARNPPTDQLALGVCVCRQCVSSAVRVLDFIIFLSAPRKWHASQQQGSERGGREQVCTVSSHSRARASDTKLNRGERGSRSVCCVQWCFILQNMAKGLCLCCSLHVCAAMNFNSDAFEVSFCQQSRVVDSEPCSRGFNSDDGFLHLEKECN